MSDLVQFLRERLDEEARDAEECSKVYPPPWDLVDRGHSAYVDADKPGFRRVVELRQDAVSSGQVEWLGDALAHVARWDPARVLADVAAKRAIIDRYPRLNEGWFERGETDLEVAEDEMRRVLQLLAAPHVGHPDYNPAWNTQEGQAADAASAVTSAVISPRPTGR